MALRFVIAAKSSSRALFIGFFVLLTASGAIAQRPSAPPSGAQRGPQSSGMPSEMPVTLVVSVRENTGAPLDTGAFVKVSAAGGSLNITSATRDAGTATFPNMRSGEYDIEVSAPQYKTAKEHASVLGAGSTYTVYVYMQPESEAGGATAPGGAPIMSPRLQAEMDKGLEKMRRQQYEAAREHFEKAAKIAPANPDVLYFLGMLEFKQEHWDAARARFEAALAIYPSHVRSLVALGELQLSRGRAEQAAQTLEKAYQINGADWRMHLLLADAYAENKEYEKATTHATRAAELAKEHGAAARLLLAEVLDAQGKRREARQGFDAVVKEFPNDPAAAKAKAQIEKLDKMDQSVELVTLDPAIAGSRSAPIVPVTLAPAIPPPARAWAPVDIDAKEYALAPDAACNQSELMRQTQIRTMKQLSNFERFTATERIEHQEVDSDGTPGPIKTRNFQYLVFVQHLKDGSSFLEESRDGGENLDEFPTSLASKGLVSLGVALFDPSYEHDLIYKCEGLRKLRGQAAWQVRFEQRPDVKSRLRTWKNSRGLFLVPLKGRVWVSANTHDVLHIETDLREPQKELELTRDHLIIDYGPVTFKGGKVSLWLPWYAEMFMELHHKRYHHRHTLTNYELFSVDTTSEIPEVSASADASTEHQAEPKGPNP